MGLKEIALGTVALLSPLLAQAGPWLGMSEFGAMSKHYQGRPCSRMLAIKKSSPRPAMAVLYGSFGKRRGCIKRYAHYCLESGKQCFLEMHWSNEHGRKYGTLNKFDLLPTLSPLQIRKKLSNSIPAKVSARAAEVAALLMPYSSYMTVAISLGLEDQFSANGIDNLYELFTSLSTAQITRSPLNPAAHVPVGMWREFHGYGASPKSTGCVINGDGQDVDFLTFSGHQLGGVKAATVQDVKGFIQRGAQRGCAVLLWAAKHQGVWFGKPSPTLSRRFRVDSSDVFTLKKLIKGAYAASN